MRCLPISLVALTLCVLFESSLSAEYVVHPDGSGDFTTIQDAIDAAEDADVILLADGTFTGSGNTEIFYNGKAVTVRSLSGNARNCIIDCGGVVRGFNFVSGEDHDSQLRGVTIRNGYSPSSGAAAVTGASPTFHGVIFQSNSAETGGAIHT